MSNRATSVCVICGRGPTIKSHLVPRALMLDLRGAEKTLIMGSSYRDGRRFKQNGDWDDGILCNEHEHIIGAGDDYGVRFVRSAVVQSQPYLGEEGRIADNPEPDLLMNFIYACIWRSVVSRGGREAGLDLGPYEPRIQRALLSGGPYDLPAIVAMNRITIAGESGKFSFLPRRSMALNLNNQRVKPWHFTIGGLEFMLFTQVFRYPPQAAQFFANGNTSFVMMTTPVLEAGGLPSFQRIIDRMGRPEARKPRG